MMMNRKRSSSREAMERTEFSKDATRLLKEFQYLRTNMRHQRPSVLSFTLPLIRMPTREFKISFSFLLFSPFPGGGGVDWAGKLSVRVQLV